MKLLQFSCAATVIARVLPVLAQDSSTTTLTAAVTQVTPEPEDNYFLFETLQLADENLDQLDEGTRPLFEFASKNAPPITFASSDCKLFPGDESYPPETLMNTLDVLLGHSLIKSVPVASVCYEGPLYDAAECDFVASQFNNSYFTLVALLFCSLFLRVWDLSKCLFIKYERSNRSVITDLPGHDVHANY